jgi:hypothetical protein
MIEVLKQALTDAKRNERHNNVAETRYWLNQYKLIAEQAIAGLESQEPVGEVDAIGLNETDFHVSFKRSMPLGTKLYTHPPQRTEQEPVAWRTCVEGIWFTAGKKAVLHKELVSINSNAEIEPLYTHPPQRTEERNFCPRCGKRTADLTVIHTCTPPQRIEQEPVTWRNAAIRVGEDLCSVGPIGYYDMTANQWLDWALSVVTVHSAPQRTWVGLAKEDRLCAKYMQDAPDGIEAVIDYIETKLKEKNT